MIDRGFFRLAAAAIARPRRTILAAAVLVLAAAPGLLRLELRTDGHALVPPADPAVLFDAEVRRHFGLRDPVVVELQTSHPDGIYNTATLRRVRQLTEALAALPEVGPDNVMSLATERRDRVYPGTLDFRPFLDPLPDTPRLVAQVRGDVEAAAILSGTLVAIDSRSTAILVGVPGSADRGGLVHRIAATAAAFASGGDRVAVVGAPVAEALLGRHILEDLAFLVPLAMAVVSFVIWLGCRRPWGVVLGLAEVGACLVWTFGLMGWLGVPVYLTTAVLPVILTTIGLADEIHVFWCYQRLLGRPGEGVPHEATVREALSQMTPPVVLTSLTTTLGFLSFLASPIAPVRVFGVFAAAGILFCLFFSLTVIPAALVLIAPEKMRRGVHGSPAVRLAAVLERPRLVLVALGVASVALGLGIARIEVQDSWIDGFAPESPFRQATAAVDERYHGTHLLLVHLTFEDGVKRDLGRPTGFGPVGALLDPALLRKVGELEDFLRRRPEVGGVLGPASHLSTVRYLWLARRQGSRSIPDRPEEIQRVLRRFDQGRGERRRREVIDDELRRAVVTVFLKDANYRDTASLMAAVRAYERDELEPLAVRVDFAGDVAVSQAMIPAIVRTQVSSLVLALAGAFAAICLLSRSLKTGLYGVAPAALAVLWTLGTMGWLGVPLGVATSMFCAVTLGIGVDYAVHFVERFRRARDDGDGDPVAKAAAEASPAILADALAIVLGFGLLGFSQVPANARLGLLVALALAASCLLTLGGLGAWLRLQLERSGKTRRWAAQTGRSRG